MATQGGPPHPAIAGPPVAPEPDEMAEIERLLRSEASSFEFFQAVRLLGLLHPERQPVGGFANLGWEARRVSSNLTFPIISLNTGLPLISRGK